MQFPTRAAAVASTSNRRRRLLAWGLLAVMALFSLPAFVRWADVHVLHETVRDAWGRWRWHEDWKEAPVLPPGGDQGWMSRRAGPVWVAHALGDSGGPAANTMASLREALAAGFKVVEVDLWLDDQRHLRCHHGPQPPLPYRNGDCEFRDLLAAVRDADAQVILDIKTDFATTGAAAVQVAAALQAGPRVVFQLYRPTDAVVFIGWSRRTALAGPLVTGYLSHRSLDHLAANAARMGVKGLVVPLQRLPALGPLPAGVALAVHPLPDCTAVLEARARGATALFLTTRLAHAAEAECLR